ncbi:MAG: hypothetical protein H6Q33_5433, partial [Deltaproteobacteria bacterium]|nr:hypothetical protein [Deltaproteobacteria bacterium]
IFIIPVSFYVVERLAHRGEHAPPPTPATDTVGTGAHA